MTDDYQCPNPNCEYSAEANDMENVAEDAQQHRTNTATPRRATTWKGGSWDPDGGQPRPDSSASSSVHAGTPHLFVYLTAVDRTADRARSGPTETPDSGESNARLPKD